MIFITNNYEKLVQIHQGALIRPGRVDRIIEFTPCSRKDACELLQKFFPESPIERSTRENIQDGQWSAAYITNTAKISKSVEQAVTLLNKHSVKPKKN